jgi:membrane-bound serine protease (ClpP class)
MAAAGGPSSSRPGKGVSLVAERRAWLGILIVVCGVITTAGQAPQPANQSVPPTVLLITVNRNIDHVTQGFIAHAVRQAEQERDALLVIQLDTPGGAYDATRKIVQHLLAADVPVAVYVTPKGARAASAGAFILAAANFAVMAPGTNIGAASPVSATGKDLGGTLQEKVTNDAAALMRSIAQERGRNGDKLEVTVRSAVSFSASEAVDADIIDFIAGDTEDLLAQLNGRTAQTAAGPVILNVASAAKRALTMTPRERFAAFVATPELVSILYTVGMIAIFIELFHPGLVAPAVIGALCLVLAFLGLGSLPFNWAGLVLLGLAAAFLIVELHTGSLLPGVGAVLAFVIGALLLFSVDIPRLPGEPVRRVSLWLIGILAGLFAVVTVLIGGAVIKTRRLQYPKTGALLIGRTGFATTDLAPKGTVQVASELWTATADDPTPIRAGDPVSVVGLEGLLLKVRKTHP